jgi:galactitol-specific phosphotransferase system IIC component
MDDFFLETVPYRSGITGQQAGYVNPVLTKFDWGSDCIPILDMFNYNQTVINKEMGGFTSWKVEPPDSPS